MHVKKTRWPIVIAGVVLAVVLSSLGVVQAQQATEKNRLDSEISLVEESIGDFQPVKSDSTQENMKSRLDDTYADLDVAKEYLSRSTDSIETNETLFNIAADCGVLVTNITISPISSEDMEDITCTILPFSVIVEGETPQLLDFIMTLNTDATNGVVKSARISVPADGTEVSPWADVKMIIYYYEGE